MLHHANTKSHLINEILYKSLSELKNCTVNGEKPTPSFGGKPDLHDHAEMLQKEFIGQSELLLYHALINVLLRRRINIESNIKRMQELWKNESLFLLEHLDTRWLVSACDTIIDHFDEPREQSLALAGTILINTIKLYETEQLVSGQKELTLEKIHGRHELFNGVSAFCIGQGDMVFNLHKRIQLLTKSQSIASSIVKELIRRVNQYDTVFKRFKEVHVNKSTEWST